MISFAAFVPHSPVLIPEVGKENIDKLRDTIDAFKRLESDLYSVKPDILLVISPHANKKGGDFFTINQYPNLKVGFKQFGDLVTKMEFGNEIGFGYKVKESCEDFFPLMMTADRELDYGTSVPLFYLAGHLPNIKIVSVGYSELSYDDHIKFGEIIRHQTNLSGKRIAVVASGDLSHKLHQDSPAGYSPRAQEFDQTVLKLLEKKDIEGILNMDKSLIQESGECGFKSLLILLGIIKELNYEPEKLSYQSPFGIGYLVEHFKF